MTLCVPYFFRYSLLQNVFLDPCRRRRRDRRRCLLQMKSNINIKINISIPFFFNFIHILYKKFYEIYNSNLLAPDRVRTVGGRKVRPGTSLHRTRYQEFHVPLGPITSARIIWLLYIFIIIYIL